MKKSLLTLLAVIVMGINSMSASIKTVIINTADGEHTTIALSEKPMVTIQGQTLVVTTENNTITYEANQTITFTLGDADGIGDLETPTDPTFYINGTKLCITGTEPNSSVIICGIDGITHYQGHTNNDGNLELSLDQYNSILVVNTISRDKSKSIKIIRK